ncbi:MAG: hypothetical protein K0S00_2159 [Xanthobacteraceae bacterium]|jgi:hypothetical protein|nr:hypothetical protein [Xanthobacteraceae bacterium]
MTEPSDDTERVSAAPDPGVAEEPARATSEAEAALERERWLRAQFEREHRVTMSVMRILLGSIHEESRRMRFWRWLIDDLRSEHRRQEALYGTDERIDAAFGRRLGTWHGERHG